MRHLRRAPVVVYLNRHEGIGLDELERARGGRDLDRLPDAAFRRAVPSAADSWIVLDETAILSIERVDPDAASD